MRICLKIGGEVIWKDLMCRGGDVSVNQKVTLTRSPTQRRTERPWLMNDLKGPNTERFAGNLNEWE